MPDDKPVAEISASGDGDASVRKSNDLRGQFSIGQMMVVTIGMSVVCAVLATVLRRLPEEQQTKGGLFILAMVLICFAALAIYYFRRAYVEKRAGGSHFITTAPLTSWFHIGGIASCTATLVLMAIGLVTVSKDHLALWGIWQYVYLSWILVAFSGRYLISAFLWKTNPKSVDVRENGLVLGAFMFLPWEHFHGFRWNKFTKKLMLLSKGRFIEWKVHESQREPLEKALIGFLPKKEGFS